MTPRTLFERMSEAQSMTDPIGTAQELIERLRLVRASSLAERKTIDEAADALQSRIAEVGRLEERVRELEAAEAARDDLGKRALEYHQETTCPCVAAERYVESCPKHGYVDGAALSLQRRV